MIKKKPYVHSEVAHNTRAAEIVVPVLFEFIQPKSVLDIGCGIGTWLKIFGEFGVTDFTGVDGDYVEKEKLHIEQSKFIAHNLLEPLRLNKKYDLVVSLEVAEHLPESAADNLIETLVSHGKVILFSAAIPGQGGQNHLNEQWPDYWQSKFKAHGFYYYDLLRPKIWNNSSVDWWYRQNMFLLFHESVKVPYSKFQGDNLIHPELWNDMEKIRRKARNWEEGNVGVENTFKAFYLALQKKIKLFINGYDGTG